MMIGVWVLLDSVRDGPVPVEPAVMAALVGTVYVMQPVIHVDAVLPRELRSGVHVGTPGVRDSAESVQGYQNTLSRRIL